ncbi:MAG: putative metal-dependent phosphoesterase TrpH [Porticoccus sp.]|jgi:predicted metal-dependent phosphoesterase TrpH
MNYAIKYDLHCHTTCSDGALSPKELVNRAAEMGVDALAITDHDTISAYQQLGPLDQQPIKIIPGIEFSTHWQNINVHIVGLNIQLECVALQEGVAFQHQARQQRAVLIADKLHQLGFQGALAGAMAIAHNGNVGRPHFAHHLVNVGAVSNIKQAFKKYLGPGKAGDIKQLWADLPQVIQWITQAGGTAVLAHPTKYKLTRTKLKRLLDDFIEAGGQGMEVVSGKQISSVTRDLASICREKNLLGSCGSDFHQPDQLWAELGQYSEYPADCPPVWEHW